MSFRIKLAAWYALSLLAFAVVLVVTAHRHLDEELRKDRWDRSHPKFPGWIIHGSYTDAEVHDILGELLFVWLWAGIPVALAGAGIGYVLARRSVRPVRRINHQLAGLQLSGLDRGVSVSERDPELASLVLHLNDLLRRVRSSYDAMQDFSIHVAHELRTPLTLLRMKLETAAPCLPQDFSEDMQEEVRHLSQLVERLLLTARAEGGKLDIKAAPIELGPVLDDLCESYAVLAIERGVTFDWHLQLGLRCFGDADLTRQILHNLLSNALRHGGSQARLRAFRAGRSIIVTLANTRRAGDVTAQGTGIGLRLVRGLCASLPSTLFLERRTPNVFAVRLILPPIAATYPVS